MTSLQLSATRLPEAREHGDYVARCDNWLSGIDPDFSRELGNRGWLGMTWPRRYGGHDRSPLERFVTTEELLAAGAPVAAHWVSDRQVGPNLLHFCTSAPRHRNMSISQVSRGASSFSASG